tara:strand:+ start:81 stop:494 length:414 start_codon:yes stop_codon:yes gene_type:complete
MKGERIIYVILILVALVIGIYGGLSGLFTPHHYYELDYREGDCTSPTAMIYENKRDNYLIFSYMDLQEGKFDLEEEDDNYIKWTLTDDRIDGLHKDRRFIRKAKLNNYFSTNVFSRAILVDNVFQTCSITKQFLQRN